MKNIRIKLFAVSLICIGLTGLKAQTVNDIDGNVYHTVTIGTQVWMVENLKTTKFNDGASIPNVVGNNEWANLKSPGYCWNNNDAIHKNTYGALYNWYTVNTGKLAPKGWHVPTDAEWSTLITFLGGESDAAGKLKETGTSHWQSPNIGATNETGFSALPGSDRRGDGVFFSLGRYGYWWSSSESENNVTSAWFHWVCNDFKFGNMGSGDSPKECGFSVRCIRD